MTLKTSFAAKMLDRQRRAKLADGLAAAVAVSLPWSISASDVLIALWLVVFLSVLDWAALRRVIVLPAAAIPVAFCTLAALGMLWANPPWIERFDSLKVFLRLLVIVLLLVQFWRSPRGTWVMGGFLASCTVLLALSWLQWFVPALTWRGHHPGVPVKDYIIQSGEFLLCAFALAHLSLNAWDRGWRLSALLRGSLGFLFLANIAFVAAARSVLVIFAAFVVVFGLQRFGWKGAAATGVVAVVLSAMSWLSSPYLQQRVLGVIQEVRDYRSNQAETSSGYRLEFWTKSVQIIADAPLVGHGTGSQEEQFRRLAVGEKGIASAVTNNPHNQTLVVAIQLGFIGVALLYAMWVAHLMLFRGSSLAAWLGTGVVVHNIGAGLFNSQLFEATLGWVYIFGVGVLGGLVLRDEWRPATADIERDTLHTDAGRRAVFAGEGGVTE